MRIKLPYKAGERVRVTSPFGYRTDPIAGEAGIFHSGVDLVGQGSKILCSPIGGKVLLSQQVKDRDNRTWEWGNYVCIGGDDGNLYYLCHMASRDVAAGDRVEMGTAVGVEGSTGRSTGSHCHFEVRDPGGRPIDPTAMLGIKNKTGEVWTVPEDSDAENAANADGDSIPAAWAAEAVRWAEDSGILLGDETGDLMLRKNATREQIAVMLYRMYRKIKNEM